MGRERADAGSLGTQVETGLEVVRAAPLNAETPAEAFASPRTPNALHFVRSHFAPPLLDPATHRVRVEGLVAAPAEWSLDALLALPARTLTVTLECAGNGRLGMSPLPPGEPWGFAAAGTATWTGVPLAAVLERAGLRDDVSEIVITGADTGEPAPFARSLPREKALDPDTLLAFEMNGRPLPRDHGAPLRLVVPGWYGVASVKWVAHIEARATPFEGWFQKERYVYESPESAPVPVTTMRVRSLIVTPGEDAVVSRGRLEVRGWAWSGEAPITEVAVSLDGREWLPATLGPELGRYAWRSWSAAFDVREAGRHTLRARARDAAGNVQPDVAPWNRLGYGNNAIAVRVFRVG